MVETRFRASDVDDGDHVGDTEEVEEEEEEDMIVIEDVEEPNVFRWNEPEIEIDIGSEWDGLVKGFPVTVPIRNEQGDIVGEYRTLLPIPPGSGIFYREDESMTERKTRLRGFGPLADAVQLLPPLQPVRVSSSLEQVAEKYGLDMETCLGNRFRGNSSIRRGKSIALVGGKALEVQRMMSNSRLPERLSVARRARQQIVDSVLRDYVIGWTSSPWDEVEEDSPDSSSAPSSSFLNSSAPMESPDRRNWRQKALVRQPWIAELRERINPLERAISFAQLFDAGQSYVKQILTNENLIQMVMHHLQLMGLSNTRRALEVESGIQYVPREISESILLSHFRRALFRTDHLFDLVMADKPISFFTTDPKKTHLDLVEELLSKIGFEETEEDPQDDTSVWDEILSTSEDPLILVDSNDELRGSSLNRLIERLTQAAPDIRLIRTFLVTYHSFVSPDRLFTKLMQRFEVPIEAGLKDDEILTIRLRVCNVLRQWIETDFSPFTPKMLQRVEDFIKSKLITDRSLRPISKTLSNTIQKKVRGDDSRIVYQHSVDPPDPIVYLVIFLRPPTFMEIDDVELARQMTLLDFEFYRKIHPGEFVGLPWTVPKLRYKAKNIMALTDHFNDLCFWLGTLVLREESLSARVKVVEKIIRVGNRLLELNNFFGVQVAISALQISPVDRLRHTYARVSKEAKEVFTRLQDIMSHEKGYKNYREVLSRVSPPCMPFLGPIQHDMVMVETNNPKHLSNSKGDKLINWERRQVMADTIHRMLYAQDTPYNLLPVHQIRQLLLERAGALEEEVLLSISKKVEPRGAKIDDIRP